MTRPFSVLVCCAAVVIGWPLASAAAAVVSLAELRSAHRPSDTLFVDRHGEPLQTLRTDWQARRGAWLALARFSPALRELLVQGEDQRFWTHGGVDWVAGARSAVSNARGGAATQGASTLTMQLAALLDPALSRPSGGRSLGQKFDQISQARAIEATWSKPQILEAYLNLVPLRGELVGVPAAAQALFGKHASGLDRVEAALLVALLRAPSAAPARVTDRACALLGLAPACERVAGVAERALNRSATAGAAAAAGAAAHEQLAPHFARWLNAKNQPGPVQTTLDAGLQRLARNALRTQLAELQGRQVEDGAVLVLDNASGEVLAWVGSSGPGQSAAPEVDAVLARRQPGSTLKPFVYGLAFERGFITPASLLHDSPADLDGGSGAFMPRNYDHRYRGWVSARTALASSLNVPTARVAQLLGPEALFDRLNAFGLQLTDTAGHHGLALALGSADVTLLQLTNAYRSLANGGLWSAVAGVPRTVNVKGDVTSDVKSAIKSAVRSAGNSAVTSAVRSGLTSGADRSSLAQRRVADAGSVFQVTDILADPSARAATFGLDSALVTRGFAAVKTGTSKDMRDNWCIGFSDRYTVGVWVGNAAGQAMQRISGTQGAAPVWRSLMQQLHAQQVSRAPVAPTGLQWQSVSFDQRVEPARQEWLRSTSMSGEAAAVVRVRAGEQLAHQQPSGIASPRDGTLFAIDPDMPASVQRIHFAGEAGQWWLDGKRLGSGSPLAWAPWPGRHRLELKSASGAVLGQVAFEVRGASVRR